MRKRVGPRRMEGDRDPHSVQAPLLSPSLLFGVMVLVYVLTAVAQPVLVDTVRHAVDTIPADIPQLCMTSAMALTGIGPCLRCCTGARRFPSLNQFTVGSAALCATLDMTAGWLLYAGLLRTGGAIFTVIYSSCTAWTALFAWWQGSTLHQWQWAGVALVTTGLGLNGLANQHAASSDDNNPVLVGALLCLGGSVVHSLFVVALNKRLRDSEMTMTPLELCGLMGTIETATLVVKLMASHNIPQLSGSQMSLVLPAVLLLVGSNWLHAISFFEVLHTAGPVVSALLKAIQTICVFVLSSVLFCDMATEAAQCITFAKSLSVGVLVSGLLAYGYGHAKDQAVTYESLHSIEVSLGDEDQDKDNV